MIRRTCKRYADSMSLDTRMHALYGSRAFASAEQTQESRIGSKMGSKEMK